MKYIYSQYTSILLGRVYAASNMYLLPVCLTGWRMRQIVEGKIPYLNTKHEKMLK